MTSECVELKDKSSIIDEDIIELRLRFRYDDIYNRKNVINELKDISNNRQSNAVRDLLNIIIGKFR